MFKSIISTSLSLLLLFISPSLYASTTTGEHIDLTNHIVGYAALAVFALAYVFVMAEEFTHLRKSKPVVLAASIIWVMIAYVYVNQIGRASCRERV